MHLSPDNAIGVYIHIPWCVRKCPYCDFNSHNSGDAIPESAYIDALILDLAQEAQFVQGRVVHTIFIGGGTPSLFSAEAYERLFSALHQYLTIAQDVEITLEANPGTLEAGRFQAYRAVGINRLSIGVQSFDNDSLTALGRIHDSSQAIKAIEMAHTAGFDNFNIDLMFGLPDQTEKKARHDIDTAIALAPSHISYYQLTIEPDTPFYNKPPALPDDDPIDDWHIAHQEQLAQAGYGQYEVSAYAKPNRQCQHNLNYWQFGDYLGIGAGAHGKITTGEQIIRRVKQKQPQRYMALSETSSSEPFVVETAVDRQELAFEFMLNAMRLKQGVSVELLTRRTGFTLETLKPLNTAQSLDLIHISNDMIQPTNKGYRYLNSLIQLFINE